MTDDGHHGAVDHARLKDLLAEAIDLPPTERDGFCRDRAGGDEELERRLRDLLHAWESATTILHSNAWGAADVAAAVREDDPGVMLGSRIGRYRIDAVVGEGGFGVVYRARQDSPVERDVAVKVLRPGIGGEEFLARFDVERQALARLSHPSIARIYDAGTLEDGRPFFAMEYVDGRPITVDLDRRRLPVEDRVRLFVDVCRAVQHAHAKGVIHRDLKPSNILVSESEGRPQVRIIDFGIAKATDEPLSDVAVVTLQRQIVGTPRYMSPEQASFDTDGVDTRTDVFSLGAVLFELLCGSTPLTVDEASRAKLSDLGRLLNEGRFERPSTRVAEADADEAARIASARGVSPESLRERLSSELDWIVLRAVASDPSERYPTANALAEDLERYLQNEPVHARPPTRMYLARKFAQRHRGGVVAGGVAILALLIAVVALAVGFVVVRAERNRALAATLGEQDAREVSDDVLAYFMEVFGSASGDELGRGATVLEAVSTGAASIDARFGDRPVLAAQLHNRAGNLFRTLGEIDLARTHLDRSADLIRSAPDAPVEYVVLIRNDRALLDINLGRAEAYGPELESVHDLAVEQLGPDHAATLLVGVNLASHVWLSQGRLDDAVVLLERTVEANTALDDETMLSAMSNLGGALNRLGRTDEAETWLLAVIERERDNPASRHRLSAMNSLGGARYRSGDTEGALEIYRSLQPILEDRFGPANQRTIVTMNNIASALQKLERYEEALAVRDDVEARAREAMQPGHPFIARLMNGRGGLLAAMGRDEEAEETLLAAYAMLSESAAVPPDVIQASAAELAEFYESRDRPEDAARWSALAAGDPAAPE